MRNGRTSKSGIYQFAFFDVFSMYVRTYVHTYVRSVADKKCDSHFDDDDDDNDEIDDTKNFSAPRKFSKKKFGATRSISSKNHENRSHPRDF